MQQRACLRLVLNSHRGCGRGEQCSSDQRQQKCALQKGEVRRSKVRRLHTAIALGTQPHRYVVTIKVTTAAVPAEMRL